MLARRPGRIPSSSVQRTPKPLQGVIVLMSVILVIHSSPGERCRDKLPTCTNTTVVQSVLRLIPGDRIARNPCKECDLFQTYTKLVRIVEHWLYAARDIIHPESTFATLLRAATHQQNHWISVNLWHIYIPLATDWLAVVVSRKNNIPIPESTPVVLGPG